MAETGFCTKRCTSDEQTPRPPSPAHHKTFRLLHKYKSFAIPLTLRCRRVWSSNLSTQLRRTQGLNTESLTMPATVADPNRSLDSEQISPATIAHHTVYEKTPNLHQSHICQWGAQPYLVGPLSRLVGKPLHSPWVSTNVLPLPQVGNNTNSAISLTEIFDRVFSDVCNSLGFEVQKQKKRGSGNNRVYRNLNHTLPIAYPLLPQCIISEKSPPTKCLELLSNYIHRAASRNVTQPKMIILFAVFY